MAMRTIDLKTFLREVKDRHTLQRAKPFCFVLGAGASKQSDIPMGGELVDRWLRVLHEDATHNGLPLEQWATAKTLGIKGFVFSRRTEFYGQIYARRFQGAHDTGHAELQSLLSGKEPSFGYSILAYILANTPHKAVITTNFDNLVADALYLYSNVAPLLCVHESLAPFITAQLDRPLVVKIHRDLLLNPRNANDEIDVLDNDWDAPLRTLFSHFTPIFLGYGGNDGSLMGFLDKLEPPVPDRIYWCVRAGSPPNDTVKALLEKRNGTLVIIPGFDEIMLALKGALDIPDLLPDLEERHRNRVERYRKQFSELNKAVTQDAKAPNATADQQTLGQAANVAVQQLQKEDTPDSWILRASSEPDKGKAEALYREALIKHPQNGNIMSAFGDFLADQKQAYVEAEKLIKAAYDADPENADRMNDYGQFLYFSKSDGISAEPLLRKALEQRLKSLGEEHSSVLDSRYNLANALLLQGRYAEAEQEHRAVLAIRERVQGVEHPKIWASRNSLANVMQAQGRYAEAEQEHRAVLAMRERVQGVEHPETLATRNNLANILQAQNRYVEAEQEQRAVLAMRERLLGMEHPETLASRTNLANSMKAQGRCVEAEQEHQAVLAIRERVQGVEHPETLATRNNLANAMQAQGRYVEAEQEQRAVLVVRERVLGAEHPSVLLTCYNLGLNLEKQKKLREALNFMQRAETGWVKVLGAENQNSKDAQTVRNRIEEALKLEK